MKKLTSMEDKVTCSNEQQILTLNNIKSNSKISC